ncbi:MAG: M20/M25/M40 family metallo-hydrolase [Gemmatimonadetes bacterium]|nr:M20/M25/M40 family metallo-hydrolase [Gemmatimonadota bacterium]
MLAWRHGGARPALLAIGCVIMGVSPLPGQVPSGAAPDYRSLARDILRELVGIRSTESGVGSTPAAEAVARRLRAGGYAEDDVRVLGAAPRKQNVVARLRGAGHGKPILIIGHLDVVDARKEDWSAGLDPFTLTEREGYFYGRGTQDMKGAAAIVVTNFIRWKKEGWVPPRDLILALTGDEEVYGDENGVKWLMANHRELIGAEYAINADGGSFQTRGGKPFSVAVPASEKKETILQLETRNRGGHASQPRKDNAIYQLLAALARVQQLRFPVALNDVTRAQLAALGAMESGPVAADLKAVAQEPPDLAAAERLSADPLYNALLRTTCVATLLDAGLGPSALPERAHAVLNCRLLPGHASADMLRTLRAAIGDDSVEITWQFNEPSEAPASPLRPEVFAAVEAAVAGMGPGVVVMPGMSTGMTDARFLRAGGIPTYGVSGLFVEQGDARSHGRDERIRTSDFDAGGGCYDRVVKALVSR